MNDLDAELYSLQLSTYLSYSFHCINLKKTVNKNDYIVSFIKNKIKNKTINKGLSNLFKHKFHIKKDPVGFMNQWNNMYSQYLVLSENLKKFKGKSERFLLNEVFRLLEEKENSPVVDLYTENDFSLDLIDKEKFEGHGYLRVKKSEEIKFDELGNLLENVEVQFIGRNIAQLYRSIDLLNITGLSLMFLTSFNNFPNINTIYIEAKDKSEHITINNDENIDSKLLDAA
jgi:hypothetical protein